MLIEFFPTYMNIQWTNVRNRIQIETIETILQVLTNVKMSYPEFYNFVLNQNELFKQVKSNIKYS